MGAGEAQGGTEGLSSGDFSGVCIFIYNLPPDLDVNFLRSLFTQYGTVINAKVPRNANGKSKGYGFVNYKSMDEAKRAIAAMNGCQISGKILKVSLKTEKH